MWAHFKLILLAYYLMYYLMLLCIPRHLIRPLLKLHPQKVPFLVTFLQILHVLLLGELSIRREYRGFCQV